ncbi:MAG TPA: undecaprenyldiphospho-muramoylpentapeptide beta-N-acetylglucosaminyltransferase [Anaerovoracaceae bacterium]|nr:undecaprenyldiphospho-muramoylpentapeptide beta-N-acetylglucosaminyltransferase [Anaerovoracaceae bacterium]
MNIILTGGGTGGHIYPAIAIGDKIKERFPETNLLYIGFKGGLEANIVPKSGFDIKYVNARWVDRKNIFAIFKTIKSVLKGKKQAYNIMKNFKPDVIIGTGGYVSYPVILAGKKYGTKLYLHEQNAYPGMANRKLSKYVNKVFIGFEGARKYFTTLDNKNIVYSGNPVRESFYSISKEESRKILGIPEDKFVIFSFGGSQGAKSINDSMIKVIEEYANNKKVHILFGTGELYYEKVINHFCEMDLNNVSIKDYITDMPNYLGAADLVIGRAGALSLAEITMCKRASILIPSPNVTGNHQYHNAMSVVEKGGAVIVDEDEEMISNIIEYVKRFVTDPECIKAMEKGSEEASMPLALDAIVNTIFQE